MTKTVFNLAFLIGAIIVIWMGANFVGSDTLALSMIILIGGVYVFGCWELYRYRQATLGLSDALTSITQPVIDLPAWINTLDGSLHNAVRMRIEGDRVGLPGPVLTPYLVGLLVMLGLLGTFAGMVGTLKGAVFALQGTTELQAIREGLAAPMKGLGMAFGTSVAGVAASAILGLISTLCRKERLHVTRTLDHKITHVFREHSLSHNRMAAYKTIQDQAEQLPDVTVRLHQMAERMEQAGSQLASQLLEQQNALHASTQTMFSELAESVASSLKESLSESGRLVGESIQPVVTETMKSIQSSMDESVRETHVSLSKVATDQLNDMSNEMNKTAASILNGLDAQRTQWIENLQTSDGQRLASWETAFDTLQHKAQQHWDEQGQKTLSALSEAGSSHVASISGLTNELQHLIQSLGQSAQALLDDNAETSSKLMNETQRLVQESETLIKQRMETEQAWLEGQNQRIDTIAEHLNTQLGALRDEESHRAQDALSRLAQLEERVAEHLSNLGASLEAPMTRLIETASETPKAAAEVIGHLRREISNNIERDNTLLTERQEIMANVNKLFTTMEESAAGQRDAIDQLVKNSADTLSNVGSQFNQKVENEVSKLTQISDHFAGSSVEIASLGEAFTTAVQVFNESNAQLMDSLSRIETALEHSATKSDEQLAYYVAQAREIIDHSMLSQKELFEELKQLGKSQRALDVAL